MGIRTLIDGGNSFTSKKNVGRTETRKGHVNDACNRDSFNVLEGGPRSVFLNASGSRTNSKALQPFLCSNVRQRSMLLKVNESRNQLEVVRGCSEVANSR